MLDCGKYESKGGDLQHQIEGSFLLTKHVRKQWMDLCLYVCVASLNKTRSAQLQHLVSGFESFAKILGLSLAAAMSPRLSYQSIAVSRWMGCQMFT